MRALTLFALSWLAVGQLHAAPATSRDPLERSGCSQALRDHYGERVTFKLVSRRNSRQGLILKVDVRDAVTGSGNWQGHYVTCRVSRGDAGEITVEEAAGGDRRPVHQ